MVNKINSHLVTRAFPLSPRDEVGLIAVKRVNREEKLTLNKNRENRIGTGYRQRAGVTTSF